MSQLDDLLQERESLEDDRYIDSIEEEIEGVLNQLEIPLGEAIEMILHFEWADELLYQQAHGPGRL